jgi:hypothetical protein
MQLELQTSFPPMHFTFVEKVHTRMKLRDLGVKLMYLQITFPISYLPLP